MSRWTRWLKYLAGAAIVIVACYAAFEYGKAIGEDSERQWWRDKMVDKGYMHYHEHSGNLHWKTDE